MCDYSLHHAKLRAANVGDKLTTRNFGTGTRGFSAPEDATTAICVLPGTELAFVQDVMVMTPSAPVPQAIAHKTAIFRQVNKDLPRTHHDALEFPDGQMVMLTDLCDGQAATVLQLPVQPMTEVEASAQKRVEYIG